MSIRKLHTFVGLALLLPFMGWIITAMVFYMKPGYDEAYEILQPKTYPLLGAVNVVPDSSWLEFRFERTILGNHLIVRTKEGWMQLDPTTLLARPKPADDEVKRLLKDAFSANPRRYGEVVAVSNDTIITSTHVHIIFNWNRMSLQQRGTDTDTIDLLYKIHYLQWTGIRTVDKILGPIGLGLVFILGLMGIRLAVASNKRGSV